jgi:hypothetical protein
MPSGMVSDIPAGGVCAWQLPPDSTCAFSARSLLAKAMTSLDFSSDQIEDAVLAVSELATNAHQHAVRTDPLGPVVAPEVWAWARVHPAPQLVVSVFDAYRDSPPRISEAEPFEEHGKGLGIVAAVSALWGSHPSRSQLASWVVSGKAVWFAIPLPNSWTWGHHFLSPAETARQLRTLLLARGIERVISTNRRNNSLVSVPCGLNIRIQARTLSFDDVDGTHVRRSPLDLSDLAEHVVRRTEEAPSIPPSTRQPKPKGSDRPAG